MRTPPTSDKKHVLWPFWTWLVKTDAWGWKRCLLLSLVSSLLLMAGFSGQFYLAFVGMVPLFGVLLGANGRIGWAALMLYVVTFYLFHMRWVGTQFHPLAIPGLLLGLAVIHSLLYFGLRVMFLFFPKHIRWTAIPIGFTLFEYLRTIGFLKFPYGIMAYSQATFPLFIQISDITGYLGISLALYGMNAYLANAWLTRQKRPRQLGWSLRLWLQNPLIHVGLFLGCMLVYGRLQEMRIARHVASQERSTLRTSLVQMWYDYHQPYTKENKEKLLEKLFRLSDGALQDEPQLVIWPESAVMSYYRHRLQNGMDWITQDYYAYFKHRTKEANVAFLAGGLEVSTNVLQNGPDHASDNEAIRSLKDYKTKGIRQRLKYNAAFLIGEGGQVQQVYKKIYLVPFVEWCPYTNHLPWLKRILESAQASDFTPGDGITLLEHEGVKLCVLICYEDCFADLARLAVQKGAAILIVITNDAWSYTRVAEIQHYYFSVFRAIETRRYCVRAANAGVTCFITPTGKTLEPLPLFEEGFLTHDVVPLEMQTIYARVGDRIVLIPLMLLIAVFAGMYVFMRQKR